MDSSLLDHALEEQSLHPPDLSGVLRLACKLRDQGPPVVRLVHSKYVAHGPGSSIHGETIDGNTDEEGLSYWEENGGNSLKLRGIQGSYEKYNAN